MAPTLRKTLILTALAAGTALAHYANMGLEGVTCYIHNGIKGTPEGHMIVRSRNGTWHDHDDPRNRGTITVIHSTADYDRLPSKTKVGIVCAPDIIESTDIGVPYVEKEPSDAEFYGEAQTVYTRGMRASASNHCIIRFCSCGSY